MRTAILLASGLCWTATYLLIIWRGLRDRTYGMPVVALCANLSWEFIFSVVRPHDGVQHVVNVVWLLLDVVIVVTVLRFGPREFGRLPRWLFYGGFAVVLVLSYLAVDLVSVELDGGHGGKVAFGQNLMMSALFIAMLMARRGTAGQSVWIAAAKFAGTVFASWYAWSYGDDGDSALMVYLFLAIALLDLVYLVALVVVGGRGRAVPAVPSGGAVGPEGA